MKLFKLNVDSYEIEWEESVLLLTPFAAIFKRDKTKHKDRANKELAYVWFFSDIKSDYQQIFDEKERSEAIVADLALNKTWKPDKVIEEAIEYYKKMSKTISSQLVEDSYQAVSKVSEYLRDVNLEETIIVNGKVKPKHDVKKVAETIRLVPQLLEALKAAEAAYLKERNDSEGRSKGSKEFNLFEDGLF